MRDTPEHWRSTNQMQKSVSVIRQSLTSVYTTSANPGCAIRGRDSTAMDGSQLFQAAGRRPRVRGAISCYSNRKSRGGDAQPETQLLPQKQTHTHTSRAATHLDFQPCSPNRLYFNATPPRPQCRQACTHQWSLQATSPSHPSPPTSQECKISPNKKRLRRPRAQLETLPLAAARPS